jgi:hypothetical protein
MSRKENLQNNTRKNMALKSKAKRVCAKGTLWRYNYKLKQWGQHRLTPRANGFGWDLPVIWVPTTESWIIENTVPTKQYEEKQGRDDAKTK